MSGSDRGIAESSAGDAVPAIAIARDAPAPAIDEHSAPFWAALAERQIVVQRCPTCERRCFPLMRACPYCGTSGGVLVEVAGTGTVYSFVRAHRALTLAYADVVPYAVAAIELDGGGRMFGRVNPPEACAIGLRVAPAFVDHASEGADLSRAATAAWTELYFRPAGPTVA